jgi:hypothetical protein
MKTLLFSLVLALAVFGISAVLQRLLGAGLGSGGFAGTVFASAVTFAVAVQWQVVHREAEQGLRERFDQVSECNDRIRNALQIIQYAVYLSHAEAKEPVYKAVDVIDAALKGTYRDVMVAPPKKSTGGR